MLVDSRFCDTYIRFIIYWEDPSTALGVQTAVSLTSRVGCVELFIHSILCTVGCVCGRHHLSVYESPLDWFFLSLIHNLPLLHPSVIFCSSQDFLSINFYRITVLFAACVRPVLKEALPSAQECSENEPLVLEVCYDGSPSPDVTWYKDGRVLLDRPRSKVRRFLCTLNLFLCIISMYYFIEIFLCIWDTRACVCICAQYWGIPCISSTSTWT